MTDFYDFQIEFFEKIIKSGKPITIIAKRWSGKEESYRLCDEFRQLQKIIAYEEESK